MGEKVTMNRYARAVDILNILWRNDDILLPEDYKEALNRTEALVKKCPEAGHLLTILYRAKATNELDQEDLFEAQDIAEELADKLCGESHETTAGIRNILKSGDMEKISKISLEDLTLFEENERQRDLYTKDGVKNLYAGICEKAVEDFKQIHKIPNGDGRPVHKTKEEKDLEKFFESEFFLGITKLRSKENAIKVIEKTMIEEKKRRCMAAMA